MRSRNVNRRWRESRTVERAAFALAGMSAGTWLALIGLVHADDNDVVQAREAASCVITGACVQRPGAPGPVQGPRVDPCYLAQNAMRPCNSTQKQQPTPVIDLNTVGIWEFPLKGGPWVWEIFRNGTYKFHSEAGDGAAAHAGTFSSNNGSWSLRATTGYTDSGTYTFQGPDTLIATGQLGTGAWRHVSKRTASKDAQSPLERKQ